MREILSVFQDNTNFGRLETLVTHLNSGAQLQTNSNKISENIFFLSLIACFLDQFAPKTQVDFK